MEWCSAVSAKQNSISGARSFRIIEVINRSLRTSCSCSLFFTSSCTVLLSPLIAVWHLLPKWPRVPLPESSIPYFCLSLCFQLSVLNQLTELQWTSDLMLDKQREHPAKAESKSAYQQKPKSSSGLKQHSCGHRLFCFQNRKQHRGRLHTHRRLSAV